MHVILSSDQAFCCGMIGYCAKTRQEALAACLGPSSTFYRDSSFNNINNLSISEEGGDDDDDDDAPIASVVQEVPRKRKAETLILRI